MRASDGVRPSNSCLLYTSFEERQIRRRCKIHPRHLLARSFPAPHGGDLFRRLRSVFGKAEKVCRVSGQIFPFAERRPRRLRGGFIWPKNYFRSFFRPFEELLPMQIPVSYTHLDVYKRQLLYYIPAKKSIDFHKTVFSRETGSRTLKAKPFPFSLSTMNELAAGSTTFDVGASPGPFPSPEREASPR